MIQQQEKNVNADTEAINALKQKLTAMIPDQTKREQAEKESCQPQGDPTSEHLNTDVPINSRIRLTTLMT